MTKFWFSHNLLLIITSQHFSSKFSLYYVLLSDFTFCLSFHYILSSVRSVSALCWLTTLVSVLFFQPFIIFFKKRLVYMVRIWETYFIQQNDIVDFAIVPYISSRIYLLAFEERWDSEFKHLLWQSMDWRNKRTYGIICWLFSPLQLVINFFYYMIFIIYGLRNFVFARTRTELINNFRLI